MNVRPFLWPALLIALAAAIYLRVEREMPDFGVYRTAATRALRAEPLYRAEDGHYQFKYLPAFAVAMAPFALLDPDAAKDDLVRAVGRTADRVRALVGARAA